MAQFPLPPPTVDRAELASWFGVTPDYLYVKLAVLQRDHGFPKKLPGTFGRWSRAAVLAWIEAGGVARPEAPPVPASTLEQIYGGAA